MVIAVIVILAFGCLFMSGCGKGDDKATDAAKATSAAKATTEETQAQATEPIATVFFASDYQQMDGWPAPAETLKGILSTVSESEKEPETFAFLGDYTNDANLHDYQLSPEDSVDEIRSVLDEIYPGGGDPVFVQGNHDRMTESLTETGLHEYNDYLIYVLNTQEDFPWKQGSTYGCLSKVKKSSGEMKKCFDELIARGEKRPVFIAGHVPLHYTARTSSRHTTGDNLYSSLIFDVVNEAGKNLDIVYLFGHNHSKGWDCYVGGSTTYKGVGETVLIPDYDENSITTDNFTEETLAFTYMNAGYTGYYMNCGPTELAAGALDQYRAADETLTGSVIQIWPDRLVINRYSPEGLHQLSGEGAADPYKGGIDSGLIDPKHYSRQVDSPASVERKNK